MIKQNLPNAVTSLNLLSGCVAIVLALTSSSTLLIAPIFIFLAAVFDFFDGFVARALKAYSPMGKELDSLADMVSFGVAPAAIVMQMMRIALAKTDFNLATYSVSEIIVVFSPFILTVFSALRLAKFNIDTRQTSSFIGLPTPGNAIFWSGLVFLYTAPSLVIRWITDPNILLILIGIQSLLMVSELPMFSLKIKNLSWADNKIRFIFIGVSIILLLTLHLFALPLIIYVFILLSIINNLLAKKAKA